MKRLQDRLFPANDERMSLIENMNTSPSREVTNAVKPTACSAKRESGSALWPLSLEMRWKDRQVVCSANDASPAANTWPDTKDTIEKLEPHATSHILDDSTLLKLSAGTCGMVRQAQLQHYTLHYNTLLPPGSSCGT